MTASVKIEGLKEVQRFIKGLETKEARRVLKATAEIMRSMQVRHFDAEQDDTGAKWQPLSAGRIKQRQKRVSGAIFRRLGKEIKAAGMSISARDRRATAGLMSAEGVAKYPILQDTGRLMNSIKAKSDANNAIVGTNVKYAPPHQYGSPKQGIPQRKFLYLNPEERQQLADYIINNLLTKKFNK